MTEANHIRRIRISLAIFIASLLVSGMTAFPLQTELGLVDPFLQLKPIQRNTGDRFGPDHKTGISAPRITEP